jgi:hypothetical protein
MHGRSRPIRAFTRSIPLLALAAFAPVLAGSGLGAQQQPAPEVGTLVGVVLDQGTGKPVSDVIVLVQGTQVGTSTGADGRFRMILPSGPHTLVIRHLAYGEHTEPISVAPGGSQTVQIKLSEKAIELAPLVVETRTQLEQRKRSSGTRINEINRKDIDEASQRGMGLGDLLKQGMPSLTVRGNCVEYRGARRGNGPCHEIYAVMDGVPVSSPALLVATIPLQDIERLEILSPAEAGATYGVFSGFGVLLIETRKGPTKERLREAVQPLNAIDWSQESNPYRWQRVVLSSFGGTAVGLASGMLVGRQCLRVSETDFSGLRPKCSALPTMGAGFVLIGLPGVAGGYAARWAGATPRSQGRLAPSALLSTLSTASGYLIWVQGKTIRSRGTQLAGMGVLFVGTPLLSAFSDRFFRTLR